MKIRKSSILNYCFIPMLSVFILATFLLTFSVNVFAMDSNSHLPYIPNLYNATYNSWVPSDFEAKAKSFLSSKGFPSDSKAIFFVYNKASSNNNQLVGYCVINPYINYNFGSDTAFNSFDFTSSNLPLRNSGSLNGRYQFYYDISNGNLTAGSNFNWSNMNIFGSTSTGSIGSYRYTTYYPICILNMDSITDVSGNYDIIANRVPVVVPDSGHAQNPMNNIPSFVPPIGMHPSQAPTVPSYTFPSLGTKPTWDTDHPFDSLFNLMDWGFSFSYDILTGILQNIIDWATFFGNLIVWIYEQIWNYFTFFIDWLYRIFEYLFSPIYDFLKALFHDGDEAISLADLLYNLYVRFDSFANTIFQHSWFTNFWTNFSTAVENSLLGFHNLLLFYDKLVQLGTVNNEFSILNLVKALFVPDPDTVNLHLMGHDDFYFYSTGHAISQKADYFVTTFSNITPVKQFYVPSCIFHGQEIGNFYIDFSFYDDYKLYGDLVISTFLTIGFVYWCILNMSNFIRGFSSVGSDVTKMEK